MRELLRALRRDTDELRRDWRYAGQVLAGWAEAGTATARIGSYLRGLPAGERDAVAARSRETATHYAWCLADPPEAPVSLWLNEYKPARWWPERYANSIHNHRYNFCTRILTGGYRHERFHARWDPAGRTLAEVTPRDRREIGVGEVLVVPAEDFHRVPTALDGTLTLLVKARPRFGHSLSFHPSTSTTQIHIPIEARVDALIDVLRG